jgi:hypothetical protein
MEQLDQQEPMGVKELMAQQAETVHQLQLHFLQSEMQIVQQVAFQLHRLVVLPLFVTASKVHKEQEVHKGQRGLMEQTVQMELMELMEPVAAE